MARIERVPAKKGSPLADIDKFPVVILSHGIGANKLIYSTFSSFLASHGFVVAVIEHTDGLGSSAKPSGERKWVFYKGWGDEDYLVACSRHREHEVRTCMSLLNSVNLRGSAAEYVQLTHDACAGGFGNVLDGVKGKLDLDHLLLGGHSYGGATAAGVAAAMAPEGGHCRLGGVMLFDPWYPAIPHDSCARTEWLSGCPCLVIGSEMFNRKLERGNIVCEGSEPGLQDAVLQACSTGARVAAGSEEFSGGGFGEGSAVHGLLLVPVSSQHSLIDDLGAVMLDRYASLFRLLGRSRAPNARSGQDMAACCFDATLYYVLHLMPLDPAVYSSITDHLSSEWPQIPLPTPRSDDQDVQLQGLSKMLAKIFETSRANHTESKANAQSPARGCFVVKEY